MSVRRPLFFTALLLLAITTLPVLSARGERLSPGPTTLATATVSAELVTCELHSVNNLIQECCRLVGDYRDGFANCTNFRKTFDKLCGTFTQSSRCRSVSVWCPHGDAHALNMVQLSDGLWYLVEPQGYVYQDYPLPSPEIPDSLLSEVMPGCGCQFKVEHYAPAPNTDAYQCSGNDFRLFIAQGQDPRSACETCCRTQSPPPSHPDPVRFREICLSGCELDELSLPRDRYCSSVYRGRACRACCSTFVLERRESCTERCQPGGNWAEVPVDSPNACLRTSSTYTECERCCDHKKGQCDYRWSLPCTGWGIDCAVSCSMKFPPQPTPEATPTVAATQTATSKR